MADAPDDFKIDDRVVLAGGGTGRGTVKQVFPGIAAVQWDSSPTRHFDYYVDSLEKIHDFKKGDRVAFHQDPKWEGTVDHVGGMIGVIWDQTLETTTSGLEGDYPRSLLRRL